VRVKLLSWSRYLSSAVSEEERARGKKGALLLVNGQSALALGAEGCGTLVHRPGRGAPRAIRGPQGGRRRERYGLLLDLGPQSGICLYHTPEVRKASSPGRG